MLRAATSTPLRRGCLVVAIAGLLWLPAALLLWDRVPGNSLISRWHFGPGRTPDGHPSARAFIRIDKRCEWQDKPPPNYRPLDREDDVPFWDETLSVDSSCVAGKSKDLGLSADNTLLRALPVPQSAYQIERFYAATRQWGDTASDKGALQLYKEQVIRTLQLSGVGAASASDLADTCVLSVPRWCVVTEARMSSDASTIVLEEPLLWLSIVVTVGGFAGSLFANQVSWLWRRTVGRLAVWVRQGR